MLNRKSGNGNGANAKPLEIALCRECGQHYYVGREKGGKLEEAVRDPSQSDFGVEYYLPQQDASDTFLILCRQCGNLSNTNTCDCDKDAAVPVKKCESHNDHPDQLKKCETCGYRRGGIGDPVQEIVHGSDGPNAVIATALHELLPENKRKVLAFADSRQDAAFFAWYAEDSYEKFRDRNFILRAINEGPVASKEGLSIDALRNRLLRQWEQAGLFSGADTSDSEKKNRQVLTSILREALTSERRLSLAGVGLIQWFVKIPDNLELPDAMHESPWNFTRDESLQFLGYLLDELRRQRAMALPEDVETPVWGDVSSWPQQAYGLGPPGKRQHVHEWGGPNSAVIKHFLRRLLEDSNLSDDQKRSASSKLMKDIWHTLQKHANDLILSPGNVNGTFRLNPRWLRIKPTEPGETWECDTCASVSTHNIRNVCPRNGCPGSLVTADQQQLSKNHYRILYESTNLPPVLHAEEHTAQIDSDEARRRQDDFKNGDIHLLSSSTTFEVGVDLGDLDTVFLRNVPPEPFNYTQRVGRAGRRETPGLALTYCRRNPHDLYHYDDPEDRIINGKVHPPRLRMTNEKIILRHMGATALSMFFKENAARFQKVDNLVGDWSNPCAVSDLKKFCESSGELADSLRKIVPKDMHNRTGLEGETWVDNIAGPESRFAYVEEEVCADYTEMKALREKYFAEGKDKYINRISNRMKTIANESTLTFLSRKAVIPKYGFPVDVVELDTRPRDGNRTGVALQRDLSQATAEYAPGGKVIANKLEYESYGVKVFPGKAWPVRHYQYDGARNFKQRGENESIPKNAKNILSQSLVL